MVKTNREQTTFPDLDGLHGRATSLQSAPLGFYLMTVSWAFRTEERF